MYLRKNGETIEYPFHPQKILDENINVSFPSDFFVSDGQLSMYGVFRVRTTNQPAYDPYTHYIKEGSPVFDSTGGVWIQQWELVEYSESEKSLINASVMANVREERARLLRETDWTQSKDIPDEVSQQWVSYRQQLRDITLQDGFPYDVVWPMKP